jgi:hypothetical protein
MYYYYDGAGGYYEEGGPIEEYRPAGTQVGLGGDNPAIRNQTFSILNEGAEDNGDPVNYTSIGTGKYYKYLWDGSGGYYLGTTLFGTFFAYGVQFENYSTQLTTNVSELNIPDGFEFFNGKYDNLSFKHNGTGGYFTTNAVSGTYFTNGTLLQTIVTDPLVTSDPVGFNFNLEDPEEVSNYYDSKREETRYSWDGGGGYTYTTDMYYFPNGTVFETIVTEPLVTSNPVGFYWDLDDLEVVSDYFDSKREETRFIWNGSGGYTSVVDQFYFPYGTSIGAFDGNNYYWDGVGGSYTEPN